MDTIVYIADGFANVIKAMGNTFAGIVGGIVPNLVVLMTIFFFIVKIIGEEKVTKGVQALLKWGIFRYTLAPFVAMLLLVVPMDFVPGKFLKESQKSAYYDACQALHHPALGLFPHIHAPEYFVYFGIASGVQALGLSLAPMNIRILLAAFVIAAIRGLANEWVFNVMVAQRAKEKKASA